jgi:hypothetical protein
MVHKNLVYFSWFITVSALIFVYGGFHPDEVAKRRILDFSLYLVLFAHLPAVVSLFRQFSPDRAYIKNILFLLASMLIQYFFLSGK